MLWQVWLKGILSMEEVKEGEVLPAAAAFWARIVAL